MICPIVCSRMPIGHSWQIHLPIKVLGRAFRVYTDRGDHLQWADSESGPGSAEEVPDVHAKENW